MTWYEILNNLGISLFEALFNLLCNFDCYGPNELCYDMNIFASCPCYDLWESYQNIIANTSGC